jgi:hypothetical protein
VHVTVSHPGCLPEESNFREVGRGEGPSRLLLRPVGAGPTRCLSEQRSLSELVRRLLSTAEDSFMDHDTTRARSRSRIDLCAVLDSTGTGSESDATSEVANRLNTAHNGSGAVRYGPQPPLASRPLRKLLYNTWLQQETEPEELALDQYVGRLYAEIASQATSTFEMRALQRHGEATEDLKPETTSSGSAEGSTRQLFSSDWYTQQVQEMRQTVSSRSRVAAKSARWQGERLILGGSSWRRLALNLNPGRLGRHVGDLLWRFQDMHLSSRERLKRLLLFVFGVSMLAMALFVWPLVVIVVISADRYRRATSCSISIEVSLYTTAVLWLSVGGYGLILVAFTRISKRPVEATGLAGIIGAAVLLSYFLSLIATEVIFIMNAATGKTPFRHCGPDCACSAAAVRANLPCCSAVLWWTDLIMLLLSNTASILLCCLPYFMLLQKSRQQRAYRRAPRYFVERPASFWVDEQNPSDEGETRHE